MPAKAWYQPNDDLYVIEFYGDPAFVLPRANTDKQHWSMFTHGIWTINLSNGKGLRFHRIAISGYHLAEDTEISLGEKLARTIDKLRRTGEEISTRAPGPFIARQCLLASAILVRDQKQIIADLMASAQQGAEVANFTFTYKLLGSGSAEADIGPHDGFHTMFVSYLSDALGDLARAVIALFTAHPTDRVVCSWQDEPGEYRWVMTRLDYSDESVYIRIIQFKDCFSRLDDSQGIPLAAIDCTWLRLATQVRGAMQQILNEFGEDGYKERWRGSAFPTQELRRLEELIRKQKRAELRM